MDGATGGAPTVWLLLGEKGGDNAQMRALAVAIGWPTVEKPLRFNRLYRVPNLALGASLASLTEGASGLASPWPDLVLASGRRSVPVARWVRRQSGGRTVLVHVGRPWAPMAWFDLVVAMPQYRLPAAANAIAASMPFNRLDPARLAAEASRWRPKLAVPGPWLGVLIGGPAKPLRFGAAEGAALGRCADRLAAGFGASVLGVGSRRTDPAALAAFEAALGRPRQVFAAGAPDNPYAAVVGLAERLLVSGDSASMIAEACRTGKPVTVFPLPDDGTVRTRAARVAGGAIPDGWRDALLRAGLWVGTRDMGGLVERLAEDGRITLADAPQKDVVAAAPPDDLPAVVERIRALAERRRG